MDSKSTIPTKEYVEKLAIEQSEQTRTPNDGENKLDHESLSKETGQALNEKEQ